MISIDEAIVHEKEVAKDIYVEAMLCHANPDDGKLDGCIERGKYHEQVAEWLEELKDYQDKNKMVVRVDVENIDSIKDKIEELSKYAESKYSKGIDDLSNILKENYDYLPQIFSQEAFCRYIDEYAEQLKAGVED